MRLRTLALLAPLGWCLGQVQPGRIMPWEEYARQPPRSPYALRIRSGAGELLYYGARHTYRPDDPQIVEIERLWEEFHPTLAFREGGVRPTAPSVPDAVRRYGEPGLVSVLAAGRRVKIRSIEPAKDVEIAAMLRDWPPERVKLYYFLRAMMGHARGTPELSAKSFADRELQTLNRTPGLSLQPHARPRVHQRFQPPAQPLSRRAHAAQPGPGGTPRGARLRRGRVEPRGHAGACAAGALP